MEKYLRNTTIIKKDNKVTKVFKIIKGTISKRIHNSIITTYKQDEIIAVEYLNSESEYDYITEELTIGNWLNYEQITTENINYLLNTISTKNRQIELLLINDPIIAFSRYIYYLHLEKKVDCFYLDKTISDLALYLKIEKRQLSKIITLLITENIITKNNKLIIIKDSLKLKQNAFKKDLNL